MVLYKARFTVDFEKDVAFLKKDKQLSDRVEKKVLEIMQNPEHYKPLRNVLKGKRRVHVGHYVLLYEIDGDTIVFHRFQPHDKTYNP